MPEDRVSLTVGELTRRGVLWEHGAGMFLVGLLFLLDAQRGAFDTSRTYGMLPSWSHLIWAGWVIGAAALLLAGMLLDRWRTAVLGLAGLAGWYVAQTSLFLYAVSHGSGGLYGPIGVYGLVLLPKAVTHMVSVISNGRRAGHV